MTINPQLFIQQFSMSSLSTQDLVSIINSKYDFTNCIVNCSSNGLCKFSSNNTFVCECLSNYAGPTCAQDTRPCSHSPCLNNATCLATTTALNLTLTSSTNSTEPSGYECVCAKNYYGTNCEFKVNICENVTCSGNGKCADENDVAICKCFSLYSGDQCEIESQKQKTIKQAASTTSIIAIVVLVLFYLLIVLSDVMDYCCMSAEKKSRPSRLRRVKKLVYTP